MSTFVVDVTGGCVCLVISGREADHRKIDSDLSGRWAAEQAKGRDGLALGDELETTEAEGEDDHRVFLG
jgi:hypothetical protein